MCLVVRVGTARPLAPFRLANPQAPHPVSAYHEIAPEPEGAPVRARFSALHVAKYGSYEGCGCGFNTESLDVWGFDGPRELEPLLGALDDEEREEYLAEQASRERLRDAVRGALLHGPVEVYACWSGDEAEEALAVEEVVAAYFAECFVPLRERVMYRVVGA